MNRYEQKDLYGDTPSNAYIDTDSVKLKEKQRLNKLCEMNTDFVSRMVDEAQQLQIKIDKLQKFIDKNPKFNELRLRKQDLMRRQLNAMQQYLEFLVLRLEMHKDD